jgi:hypothetical protein
LLKHVTTNQSLYLWIYFLLEFPVKFFTLKFS